MTHAPNASLNSVGGIITEPNSVNFVNIRRRRPPAAAFLLMIDTMPLLSAVTLAFLIPLPFFGPVRIRTGPPPAHTDPQAWEQVEALFKARGVAVVDNHIRCREPDLYGLYVRGQRAVVVCNRGDRSDTLRHEGWHLVQHLCLGGVPWLSGPQWSAGLSRRDQRELQTLVRSDQWQREAEARLMAKLAPNDYLLELQRACGQKLPVVQEPETVFDAPITEQR